MSAPGPSVASQPQRVLTLAPMPPEKLAYALARYSRSPDSIGDSLEWVKTHDSAKFLDSFYFQYGHASIADLGHLAVCFEGISELAATELEDEQLWDGQARSSRYQDFSRGEAIVPPELSASEVTLYQTTCERLFSAYRDVHARTLEALTAAMPCPSGMKPDAYRRNLSARAFDVARYLLPFGVPTGVGQVTSIRTLERQVRRLKASEFQEVRELGDEVTKACAAPARCALDGTPAQEPVAPTLAKYVHADEYAPRLRADVAEWAKDHLPPGDAAAPVTSSVDLIQPRHELADICASLLYPVSTLPFRTLYELAERWPEAHQNELLRVALGTKPHRDELPRAFRSAPFALDIVMDIGAYRDLHRHRRCHQFRQAYTNRLGYELPEPAVRAGVAEPIAAAYRLVDEVFDQLPAPASQYVLPLGARSRFLFKMDLAELEYIARLRSGVKGHFSYRRIAWQMKQALERTHPSLASLIDATPPWVEDPLTR